MSSPARPTKTTYASGDRINTVANFILGELQRHFSDYSPQDLLAGCIGAGVIARQQRAVPRSVLDVVRTFFRTPLEAIPMPSVKGGPRA